MTARGISSRAARRCVRVQEWNACLLQCFIILHRSWCCGGLATASDRFTRAALRHFFLCLIRFFLNSLQDLFSRHPVADERPQDVLPIPYGERPTDYRWNSDPLDLDGRCEAASAEQAPSGFVVLTLFLRYGGSEMDAGYFVLPYWMVSSARCRVHIISTSMSEGMCSPLWQGRFHRFIDY